MILENLEYEGRGLEFCTIDIPECPMP